MDDWTESYRALAQPCPQRPDGRHVLSLGLWSRGEQSGLSIQCRCRLAVNLPEDAVLRGLIGNAADWISSTQDSQERYQRLLDGAS